MKYEKFKIYVFFINSTNSFLVLDTLFIHFR